MKQKFIRVRFTYYAAFVPAIVFFIIYTLVLIKGYQNGSGWEIKDYLILLIPSELLVFPLFPIGQQTVHIDKEKVVLKWFAFNLRTIYWSEVVQTGIAEVFSGYGMYKDFIYIAKRKIQSKDEMKNLTRVKDKRNFIIIESRKDVEEVVNKYSPVEFEHY